MIGQLDLVAQLSGYTVDNFPHSLLFLGEKGCGRHTLINEICQMHGLEQIDITDKICLDSINEATLNLIPTMYVIDLDKITEKQQNTILKFLEEPAERVYITLISTVRSLILDTVYNRCVAFEFKPYSQDELKEFVPKDIDASLILRYCHTPGQILNTKIDTLTNIVEDCDKIVNVIGKAKYSNLFNLIEKVKKDYDLNLFYNVLLDSIYNQYQKTNDNNMLKLYNIVEDSLHKLMDLRYDRECLLISMISEMWEACRSK